MFTIASALAAAQKELFSSDTPKLDAEVLLGFVLQQNRAYLYTWPEQKITREEERRFLALIERRVCGEPVAYLVGTRDFWSFSLRVNSSTLIPRPETELLVELALQRLPETCCQVLDLGSGSGAIALALARERPAWQISGCDSNEEAVKLATWNAGVLDLSQVHFLCSHWFDQVERNDFNLIVSNPPYIAEQDEHLLAGDVRFEPRSALVAKKNGFADLEYIIDRSRNYLRPGGWLALEHGFMQAAQVRSFMLDCGYEAVETFCDLAGCERVTLSRKPARN